MSLSDIAVTTLSLIRTDEEREVVLKTIEALGKLTVPIVIVDGGSAEKDKAAIRSIPNVELFEAKGLHNQLMLSHREAAKRGSYLFYLQSDKQIFVEQSAGEMLEAYRSLADKGMLVPVRTQASIETYLPYQRRVEEFLNFFIGDYIGTSNDYYAGPAIYPAMLVPYLDQLTAEIGWGIEAYFYVLAKRLNMPFTFLPAISTAPVDVDSTEETRDYRLQITRWQIEGFLAGQHAVL